MRSTMSSFRLSSSIAAAASVGIPSAPAPMRRLPCGSDGAASALRTFNDGDASSLLVLVANKGNRPAVASPPPAATKCDGDRQRDLPIEGGGGTRGASTTGLAGFGNAATPVATKEKEAKAAAARTNVFVIVVVVGFEFEASSWSGGKSSVVLSPRLSPSPSL